MTRFTLCEDTGMPAVDGACPAHRGDACLREYIRAPRVRAAWAAAERVVEWIDRLDPAQRADVDALLEVADAACACGRGHYCADEVILSVRQ